MSRHLVECIPNFSEGRDRERIEAIADSIRSVGEALLLGEHSDVDHNRSVMTFAGEPEAVAEAAVRAAGKAAELIDLGQHHGEHPRIGACDVIPLVPISGVDMEMCVRLAHRVGEEIWRRFGVPIFYYGEAARQPGRANLAEVRRGQFEGLREAVRTDAARRPDIGGPLLHLSAGATAVGARKILIAYNIELVSGDIQVARAIARKIRASSGGLPAVKAMGVLLDSRGRAQVSCNLTDYEITPPHVVFDEVKREAERLGTAVAGSEIVGLIPARALSVAGGRDLMIRNFHRGLILENRLAEAAAEQQDRMG